MQRITYEDLRAHAIRCANLPPDEKLSLADAVEVMRCKPFPFPTRLAEHMAQYIEESRLAHLNGTAPNTQASLPPAASQPPLEPSRE